MSSQITLVEKPVFIKSKHELAKVMKALDKASNQAVDLIVNTMNSTNSEVTPRMKLDCAKSLLELQLRVSAEISKDELLRQMAEIKVNGLSRSLGEDTEQKKLAPKVDFLTIQNVE
jgi:GTPase Era involved in 16S rRNA processing